jgi:hypothetical protein
MLGLKNVRIKKDAREYQRVRSVTITKHHPLLVLLIYIILRSYIPRIVSTNPQVVYLNITCHDWICNTIFGAPQTLTCNSHKGY